MLPYCHTKMLPSGSSTSIHYLYNFPPQHSAPGYHCCHIPTKVLTVSLAVTFSFYRGKGCCCSVITGLEENSESYRTSQALEEQEGLQSHPFPSPAQVPLRDSEPVTMNQSSMYQKYPFLKGMESGT